MQHLNSIYTGIRTSAIAAAIAFGLLGISPTASAQEFNMYTCIGAMEQNFGARYTNAFARYTERATAAMHTHYTVDRAAARLLADKDAYEAFLAESAEQYSLAKEEAKNELKSVVQAAIALRTDEVNGCKAGQMPVMQTIEAIELQDVAFEPTVPAGTEVPPRTECHYTAQYTFGHGLVAEFQQYLQSRYQALYNYYYIAKPTVWALTDATERATANVAAKNQYDQDIANSNDLLAPAVDELVETIKSDFTSCQTRNRFIPEKPISRIVADSPSPLSVVLGEAVRVTTISVEGNHVELLPDSSTNVTQLFIEEIRYVNDNKAIVQDWQILPQAPGTYTVYFAIDNTTESNKFTIHVGETPHNTNNNNNNNNNNNESTNNDNNTNNNNNNKASINNCKLSLKTYQSIDNKITAVNAVTMQVGDIINLQTKHYPSCNPSFTSSDLFIITNSSSLEDYLRYEKWDLKAVKPGTLKLFYSTDNSQKTEPITITIIPTTTPNVPPAIEPESAITMKFVGETRDKKTIEIGETIVIESKRSKNIKRDRLNTDADIATLLNTFINVGMFTNIQSTEVNTTDYIITTTTLTAARAGETAVYTYAPNYPFFTSNILHITVNQSANNPDPNDNNDPSSRIRLEADVDQPVKVGTAFRVQADAVYPGNNALRLQGVSDFLVQIQSIDVMYDAKNNQTTQSILWSFVPEMAGTYTIYYGMYNSLRSEPLTITVIE